LLILIKEKQCQLPQKIDFFFSNFINYSQTAVTETEIVSA